MSNYKKGDRIRYTKGPSAYVDMYREEKGNPAEAIVTEVHGNSVSANVVTGPYTDKSGLFLFSEIEPVTPTGMRIISLKRSTHKTGLKVYGKVLGESGKEYNVAYFRRPTFRGWICSCENFFFTMFAKKRNCKHLRFVRQQVGRFAASVK